jgi:hypothetical protein
MACNSFGTRLLLHGITLVVVLLIATMTARAYDANDTLSAIEQASTTMGIPQATLTRIVACETGYTFWPDAVGDHGASLGAVQLNRYGNAWPAFITAGYTDPMNPFESVEFLARALRGDFPHLGAWTWSCR